MKLVLALVAAFMTSQAVASKDAKMMVDTENSKVNWFAKKVIGNDSHKGFIPLKSAEVTTDAKGAVTGGTFVFNMKGFESTDLSGNMKAKFEGHLKSADFFNVDENETATLTIKSVSKDMAKGELSFNGVDKPVTLKFKKKGMVYAGSFDMDRTKWGVKYGSNKFFDNLADKAIADTVKIDFTITLTKGAKKDAKKAAKKG